ncbi:uncharacterized protein KY384_004105 [Bacidia gigantensis]|uniref:uncharacterized protein n=1 Tax=Bacidia gigantensis TaxID=2732470 RepID=UPI001D0476B7|nr:uncharacterized protein KY384_004105 [Bacidia gigantensis]KAG8530748.1 hypothetical protein KY384_004105 [Bacidia gigantensis]
MSSDISEAHEMKDQLARVRKAFLEQSPKVLSSLTALHEICTEAVSLRATIVKRNKPTLAPVAVEAEKLMYEIATHSNKIVDITSEKLFNNIPKANAELFQALSSKSIDSIDRQPESASSPGVSSQLLGPTTQAEGAQKVAQAIIQDHPTLTKVVTLQIRKPSLGGNINKAGAATDKTKPNSKKHGLSSSPGGTDPKKSKKPLPSGQELSSQ